MPFVPGYKNPSAICQPIKYMLTEKAVCRQQVFPAVGKRPLSAGELRRTYFAVSLLSRMTVPSNRIPLALNRV